MDNRYRRDHEMAYYADASVIEEQLAAKKAVREYNTVMPFDPEKGLECLDRAGIIHGKNVYFEPPFHCEYGNHITLGENFYSNTGCVMLDVAKIRMCRSTQQGIRSIRTAGTPGTSTESLLRSEITYGSEEAASSFPASRSGIMQ